LGCIDLVLNEALDFKDVYAKNVRFVWRTLRLLGVPESMIEDAVQDVFVVVHRRLPEFRASATATAWIYQIARRVARDYRRKMRRKGGLEPLSDGMVDDQPDATQHVARAEAVRLLESVLAELDEKGREVLVLTEIEEMSAPDLAALLNVPLNTVYSRLRRARAAFNLALQRRGGSPS
jgi:RNA polymerase sigma-70 factor, ECF subfamily